MSRAARGDRRMREAARAIFERCVGSAPRRIVAESGGQTNHVFRVDGRDGSFVLRMSSEEGKIDDFRKEHWAVECARRADIPAPEILKVEATDGVAWMLAHRTPGWPGTRFGDSHETLGQLGRLARALHELELSAFGADFDGREPPPWREWAHFLDEEFRVDERLAQLQSHGFLDGTRARHVAEVVRGLGDGREPRLNHGDLRLKNVLVDVSGRITALIDWEMATAAPAPEWDLAIALHDLSVDQKDAFVDGYGLADDAFESLGPALAALNVLHYAPFVEAAARDDDTEQLLRYRRRFARLYDLYSVA